MAVYVDEIVVWPGAKGIFAMGSCHLTADTLDELHAFAAKVGMKREWFQDHALCPHYDLTRARRKAAVKLGAIEEGAMDGARRRRAARKAAEHERKAHLRAIALRDPWTNRSLSGNPGDVTPEERRILAGEEGSREALILRAAIAIREACPGGWNASTEWNKQSARQDAATVIGVLAKAEVEDVLPRAEEIAEEWFGGKDANPAVRASARTFVEPANRVLGLVRASVGAVIAAKNAALETMARRLASASSEITMRNATEAERDAQRQTEILAAYDERDKAREEARLERERADKLQKLAD